MTDPPRVHAAIAAVIAALPGIGKDEQMGEGSQSYKYRGIERIKAELKPLLSEHRVHYAPNRVRESIDEPYQTSKGSTWQRTRLTVTYRIYGPDGSYIEAEGRGEGTDASDKGSNKAMTSAEKQMLLQVFCVADSEDPDHERGEEQASSWSVAQVKVGIASAIEEQLKVDHGRAVGLASKVWTQLADSRTKWAPADVAELIDAAVSEAASIDALESAVEGDAT